MLRKILLALSENKSLYRFIVTHDFSKRIARRFIAGETLSEAIAAARALNAKPLAVTFDHLGENVQTREEAQQAALLYCNILNEIHKNKISSNVSLKLTELGLDIDENLCLENLEKILRKARDSDNFIRVDMEGSPYTDRTLRLVKQAYANYKNVGVVIQAYLYRSEHDLKDLTSLGMRVRLCKGAYHESPKIAFPSKKDVDKNYIKLMKLLLRNGHYPAIATHDITIIEITKQFAQENQIAPERFEFQMLYGIRPQLQEILVKQGYNVRIYVPYGEQWYPYFMRRLAERPANVLFFLTSFFKS